MRVMFKSLISMERLQKNIEIDVGFRMRQYNVAEIPEHVTNFD